MATLAQQRCFHHALREAVARCPECHRFYCRECITEHEERVICSTCLRQWAARPARPSLRRRLAWLFILVPGALGLVTAWLFFYFVGTLLLSVPTSFHDGTVWTKRWQEP